MKQRPAKPGLERLQKVLAEAGVAARRVCEQMIEAGRVTVNGEVVSKLPVFVTHGVDDIAVDGRRISKSERHLYIMLNKPERTLVTSADEPGMERRTIMDLVDHPAKARLFPVGRLDFDTTGLVLLTNDGDLAHRLTHPSFGIVKTYHASVKGQVDDALIDAVRTKLGMARSRDADTGSVPRSPDAQPMQEIVILRREPGRTLLEITISEARNREIREVLKMLGAPVKRLSRMGIGALTLRGLPVGAWRELSREEIQMVRRSGKGEKPEGIRRPAASIPRRPAKRKPVRAEPQEFDEEGLGLSEQTSPPPRPRQSARPNADADQRPSGRPTGRPTPGERRGRPVRTDKPQRTDRPDRADSRDRGEKPARPARPERSGKPERTNRPERTSRPDRTVRPDRASKPERSDNSDRPAKPNRSARPWESARPTGDRPPRGPRTQRGDTRDTPSDRPTRGPSRGPSRGDSRGPSGDRPTGRPSGRPTGGPSGRPTGGPDGKPSRGPNSRPSGKPGKPRRGDRD